MKNLLFLLATIGIIFTACEGGESVEEDNGSTPSTPKIELSQQNMEVEFEPTQYTVSVTSPYSWEAISKNDWIVVDTKSGIAGTKELKFSVLRNEEFEIREGTIVVKNETANLFAELYVTQKAFVPVITIEPESLAFAADGGTQEVTITTNIEYEFSKDVDWLTLEKSEKGVKVTVTVNNKQEERTAKFSISNEKYKLTKSISISQVAFEVVLDLYIASMDIEGTAGNIVIDREKYTATIPLAEDTNIEAVRFNNITFGCEVINGIGFTPDMTQLRVSKNLNNRIINMSHPEFITLSYFQTYEWKIVATQNINRIWTVDGQIGATEWDLEGHRAIVKRRQDYPLDNVKTTDVRFGPRPTYDYPEIAEMPTNFDNAEMSRTITVAAHDRSTIWELVVVPTKVVIDFE